MPIFGKKVYIDPQACVIGDVVIGDDSSIWPMAVIRGDVNSIRIGVGTNIQDNCTLHVTHKHTELPEGRALTIGDNVTVGHQVVLHACTIGSHCLIGIGSIILDGAVIPDGVMIGASSLVTEEKKLESGYLYLGSPAKAIRPLTEAESKYLMYSAQQYIALKNNYLSLLK